MIDFPDAVSIIAPEVSGVDPDTGNEVRVPGARRDVRGNVQRRPYFTPEGVFVRNDWILLLPPGEPITSDSRVIGRGHKFEVDDLPADRRDGSNGWVDEYVAVPLRYIGDMQGESE